MELCQLMGFLSRFEFYCQFVEAGESDVEGHAACIGEEGNGRVREATKRYFFCSFNSRIFIIIISCSPGPIRNLSETFFKIHLKFGFNSGWLNLDRTQSLFYLCSCG